MARGWLRWNTESQPGRDQKRDVKTLGEKEKAISQLKKTELRPS